MKCQILFSGKNITNLSSAELAKRAVTVNVNKIRLVILYFNSSETHKT